MKKFLTVLISCSLMLAASAMAQQEDEQQQEQKKKQAEKAHPGKDAKQGGNGESARKERAETKASAAAKAPAQAKASAEAKAPAEAKGAPKPQASESAGKPETAATAPGKEQGKANREEQAAEQRKNERAAQKEPANKAATAAPTAASAQPSAAAAGAAQANKRNPAADAKKPDAQQLQAIKAQHANFRAQPKPEKVPPVTFNQSYRINGADQWQGEKYSVFRSYRPEMHDQGWYRSHYNRVELIGGGYYYWNNGYWYPAWGYSPSESYYAYDAPIYVGHSAEPPDRVIANVQATLQQMGYYQGEVDGLLGPLTREALTAYQSDHGLYTTAVIDEPTLDSLGMG